LPPLGKGVLQSACSLQGSRVRHQREDEPRVRDDKQRHRPRRTALFRFACFSWGRCPPPHGNGGDHPAPRVRGTVVLRGRASGVPRPASGRREPQEGKQHCRHSGRESFNQPALCKVVAFDTRERTSQAPSHGASNRLDTFWEERAGKADEAITCVETGCDISFLATSSGSTVNCSFRSNRPG